MLSLYRDALRLRRTLPDLHDPSFAWRGSPADVLIFDPGQTLGASSTCPTGHSHSPATAHRRC